MDRLLAFDRLDCLGRDPAPGRDPVRPLAVPSPVAELRRYASPGRTLWIASAIVWIGLIAALLSATRAPSEASRPSRPAVLKAEQIRVTRPPLARGDFLHVPAIFAERWNAVAAAMPRTVPGERVTVGSSRAVTPEDVTPSPPIVTKTAQATVTPKTRSAREGICKKGKRWIKKRGWKTWRCRR